MTNYNYFIGIDGGGTKTKFILANQFGEIFKTIIKPTTHYLQCGIENVGKILNEGVNEVIDGITTINNLAHIYAAVPGYHDIKKDDVKIESSIYKYFSKELITLGNDTENALAGSLAGSIGINIISGTGSIGYGIDDKGQSYRCGGWNHLFGGDEGSAYWIASKLILEFTRQSDGRDSKTPLYQEVKKYFDLEDDYDIITKTVVELGYNRTEIAKIASLNFKLALKNDKHALRIYQEAAKELADIIIAIINNLDFKEKINISYSGGVFKSKNFIIKPLQKYLNQ